MKDISDLFFSEFFSFFLQVVPIMFIKGCLQVVPIMFIKGCLQVVPINMVSYNIKNVFVFVFFRIFFQGKD